MPHNDFNIIIQPPKVATFGSVIIYALNRISTVASMYSARVDCLHVYTKLMACCFVFENGYKESLEWSTNDTTQSYACRIAGQKPFFFS